MAALLDGGADPDLATPIFEAARGRSPDAVRLLLEHGAKSSSDALDWVENVMPKDEEAAAANREIGDLLRAALAD
jgi:Ankyrin repeat